MQAEPALLQPGAEQVEPEQENQQNLYDFSHCTRIKKLTTHEYPSFHTASSSLNTKTCLSSSNCLPPKHSPTISKKLAILLEWNMIKY